MRFIAILSFLGTAAFAANSADPSPSQIDDIIAKFAAKEAAFQQARSNYTYRQTARVMSLDDGGNTTGKWEEVTDIIFTLEGKRTERVVHAPMSTLTAFQLDPGDIQDLREVQPFVLTTDELPKYYIRYLGREQLDEISCYAFAVKPKKMESGQRYFEGEVWVDDKDLQIVKSYGRGEGAHQSADHQYPKFETYREQIDGKYWFPDLHHRQRHAAFQGIRSAHEDDREVRGLQAVQERHHDQVRRCRRTQQERNLPRRPKSSSSDCVFQSTTCCRRSSDRSAAARIWSLKRRRARAKPRAFPPRCSRWFAVRSWCWSRAVWPPGWPRDGSRKSWANALGETVGYQVRFEEVAGPRTRLRFLTEGILTRRLISDPRSGGRRRRGAGRISRAPSGKRPGAGVVAPAANHLAAGSAAGRDVGDARRRAHRRILWVAARFFARKAACSISRHASALLRRAARKAGRRGRRAVSSTRSTPATFWFFFRAPRKFGEPSASASRSRPGIGCWSCRCTATFRPPSRIAPSPLPRSAR